MLFVQIAIFVFVFNISVLYGQALQILPVGNSITQADVNYYSYRYYLWTKLIDDDIEFNFVGTLSNNMGGNPDWPTYNGQNFDQDHEGHSGWEANDIADALPNWLSYAYTPDIALIHLGTNDLLHGQSVSSTINDLKEIINILRLDNPNVILLLAQLIPTTYFFSDSLIQLNSEIPYIAVDLYDPDSPIYIVDQYSDFNIETDLRGDGLHPNDNGEEKMAQKWREVINYALGAISLDIDILLEGPFNNSGMDDSLYNHIPVYHPYGVFPWNYSGTENVLTVPNNVVDWVLIEIRDTTQVDLAIDETIVARQAAFLLNDGSVVGLDGTSNLQFNISINNQIYVVVRHRNHLPVISQNALVEVDGIYSYDFTNDANKALGGSLALKDMGGGWFGMIAGDSNADGEINDSDIENNWPDQAGKEGYFSVDFNMNSQVNNPDKNEFWRINTGYFSQLP